MYKVSKIFGRISRGSTAILLFIFIPFSILISLLGLYLIFFELIMGLFMRTTDVQKIVDQLNSLLNLTGSIKSTDVLRYVGIGLVSFTFVFYFLYLMSQIIRKTLYKSIRGIEVARNKEFRNSEINKVMDRLERYRYRE